MYIPKSSLVILFIACSFAIAQAQSSTQFSETPVPYKGSKITVNSVAYSADGSLLVGGSQDKSIYVWYASNAELKFNLDGHKGPVTAVDVNPKTKQIASGSYNDESVRIWNSGTGKQELEISGHRGIMSLAYSSNGSYLATSGGIPSDHKTGTINIWNAKDGSLKREVFREDIGKYHPSCVAFSPDNKFLACGFSNDKHCVKIWNVETGELVKTISHISDVTGIAYSPDGTMIAGGGVDKILYIWNSKTGAVIHKLSGHAGYIGSVSFSPDGKLVASCGMDRQSKFKVWDVSAGKLVQSIDRRCSDVNTVKFSPDGGSIAIGVTTYGDLFSVATVEVYKTGQAVEAADWPKYQLKPTRESIAFPASPEVTTRQSGAYTYHRQLLTHGYYVYDVNIVEYPRAPATQADRTSQCTGMAGRYRDSRNATIVTEESFSMDGEIGKDYVMTSGDKRYRYRIVMKGKYMYQISFLSRNKESCAEEEKFMKSFGAVSQTSNTTTNVTPDRAPTSASLTPISDAVGGFEATFYSRPTSTHKKNEDGTVTTTYEGNYDQMTFRISSIDFSRANYDVSDEQMVDLMAKDYIKRAKGKVTSQSEISQDNAKGRDYVLLSGSTRIRYKILIKGKKLYQITCGSKNNSENARERAFYKSVKLLD